MNPTSPTFIVMKRELSGPDVLGHGQSFGSARRELLHAEGLDAGAPHPCAGPAESDDEDAGPDSAEAGPDSDADDAPRSELAGPDGYAKQLAELKRMAGQLQDRIESLGAPADSEAETKDTGPADSHGKQRVF
tara:strand:- start:348 stop:746 length:399 start_codon:yes stop_codon:yes gene_type:complete